MARREPAKRPRTSRLLDDERVRARFLPGPPNRWVLHVPGQCKNMRMGGCFHCGLPASNYPSYTLERLEAELRRFRRYAPQLEVKVVKAGTFGSLREVPGPGRLLVYAAIQELGIEEVQVEFRPELVDAEILAELREELAGIRVACEVGLDHKDAKVRNGVLNRNHSLRDFRRAVRLINRAGLISVAFVAVGLPIGWTERQAIAGAVATAEYAIRTGCQRIWFEPVVLQRGTLQWDLYDQEPRLWAPIWLWSIREVLLRVYDLAHRKGVRLLVGGPVHEPPPDPDSQPWNRCRLCTERFHAAFKWIGDAESPPPLAIKNLRGLKCDCYSNWMGALDRLLVPRRQVKSILAEFDESRAAMLAAHEEG